MKTNTFHAKKVLMVLFAVLLPVLAKSETVIMDHFTFQLSHETLLAEIKRCDTLYTGEIVIPPTVTHQGLEYSISSIAKSAFYNCSKITSMTIPASVTSIDNPFGKCDGLKDIIFEDSETELTLKGTKARNSFFDGCPLEYCYLGRDLSQNTTTLSYPYFRGISTLKKVVIGNNVSRIEAETFENCTNLEDITLPEDLNDIGSNAFHNTLWYNNQSEGLVYIGNTLYNYKGNMSDNTSISIKEGTIGISDGAFSGCHNLTAINIPEGVTSIGNEAFKGCSGLTAINIPKSMTSIGRNTFSGCWVLPAITIPEGVTSIGDGAFYDCRRLTAINIPKSMTSIGSCVFLRCSSLTAITIPESVTSIGEGAFQNCSSLTAINIPEKSQLTSIGNYAFYDCSNLTAITIPEGVTSIGDYTFYKCSSLKELTLGKGLKKIAVNAFSTCKALEKITIHATQPPRIEGEGNALFSDDTYENATLYVPQGCISKYQVMTGWSGFYNISEMEGGTPDYLTIRQADNGAVGIAVDLGRTYKVCITPSTGWKVHTVTFNGTDITAQLADDNTLTTPTISGSSELVVAYEKNGNAVESTRTNAIKVQGHQGIISITGATEGEAISVYTASGTLVTKETAEDDTTHLTVPTGQVYIVTIGEKVVKIGM